LLKRILSQELVNIYELLKPKVTNFSQSHIRGVREGESG